MLSISLYGVLEDCTKITIKMYLNNLRKKNKTIYDSPIDIL